MAPSRAPSAALLRSLRAACFDAKPTVIRSYSITPKQNQEVQSTSTSAPAVDPATVTNRTEEKALFEAGTHPIGSRRRRAAMQQTGSVPFDQLPYQCFQEARQILIADREEKLRQIEVERVRLERAQALDPATIRGGEKAKQLKIKDIQKHMERLKIYADINDANVKRRFEDGYGDLSKPIYRFLTEKKWREYRRKIQVQRIETMKLVPDVIPLLDLEVDIQAFWGRRATPPGDFVDSGKSERPPRLSVQSFVRGERLLTVAVIDPDVPNVETDLFESRCHFLATNIVITPTNPIIDLAQLPESQVILPWLPPHAQKGSPYHRQAIVLLEHNDNIPLEKDVLAKMYTRDSFNVRTALTRHPVRPIGAALFRTKWDDSTADVMMRNGLAGANIELKRKKVEPLPYKRRNPSSFR